MKVRITEMRECTVVDADLPEWMVETVRTFLDLERKISAIKFVRAAWNDIHKAEPNDEGYLGLREAKLTVEYIEQHMNISSWSGPQRRM